MAVQIPFCLFIFLFSEECQRTVSWWLEVKTFCFPVLHQLKVNVPCTENAIVSTVSVCRYSNHQPCQRISLWTSFSEVLSLIFQNHSIIILMLSFMWQSWVVSKDRIKRGTWSVPQHLMPKDLYFFCSWWQMTALKIFVLILYHAYEGKNFHWSQTSFIEVNGKQCPWREGRTRVINFN